MPASATCVETFVTRSKPSYKTHPPQHQSLWALPAKHQISNGRKPGFHHRCLFRLRDDHPFKSSAVLQNHPMSPPTDPLPPCPQTRPRDQHAVGREEETKDTKQSGRFPAPTRRRGFESCAVSYASGSASRTVRRVSSVTRWFPYGRSSSLSDTSSGSAGRRI